MNCRTQLVLIALATGCGGLTVGPSGTTPADTATSTSGTVTTSATTTTTTSGTTLLADCDSLANGETESQVFYEVESVAPEEDCADHSELRERTCVDGQLSEYSGTFAFEDCVVLTADGRPGGDYLENYVLDAGLITVTDVGDNLSGATWNPLTNSYFGAINPARVVELLSPVSSTITSVDSWSIDNRNNQEDFEGVTWVQDDLFVIADERGDRAIFVNIVAGSGVIDLDNEVFSVLFPEQSGGNGGLEGLSFAAGRGQCGALFAIQESPYELYEVELPCLSPGVLDTSADVDHSQSDRDLLRLPGFGQSALRNCRWDGTTCDDTCTTCDKIDIQDFAGLTYVPATGRVIVVSENVGFKLGGLGTTDYIDAILEVGPDANGQWGITELVTLPNNQSEGVTIGHNGELLIFSEPNIVLRMQVP